MSTYLRHSSQSNSYLAWSYLLLEGTSYVWKNHHGFTPSNSVAIAVTQTSKDVTDSLLPLLLAAALTACNVGPCVTQPSPLHPCRKEPGNAPDSLPTASYHSCGRKPEAGSPSPFTVTPNLCLNLSQGIPHLLKPSGIPPNALI